MCLGVEALLMSFTSPSLDYSSNTTSNIPHPWHTTIDFYVKSRRELQIGPIRTADGSSFKTWILGQRMRETCCPRYCPCLALQGLWMSIGEECQMMFCLNIDVSHNVPVFTFIKVSHNSVIFRMISLIIQSKFDWAHSPVVFYTQRRHIIQ